MLQWCHIDDLLQDHGEAGNKICRRIRCPQEWIFDSSKHWCTSLLGIMRGRSVTATEHQTIATTLSYVGLGKGKRRRQLELLACSEAFNFNDPRRWYRSSPIMQNFWSHSSWGWPLPWRSYHLQSLWLHMLCRTQPSLLEKSLRFLNVE